MISTMPNGPPEPNPSNTSNPRQTKPGEAPPPRQVHFNNRRSSVHSVDEVETTERKGDPTSRTAASGSPSAQRRGQPVQSQPIPILKSAATPHTPTAPSPHHNSRPHGIGLFPDTGFQTSADPTRSVNVPVQPSAFLGGPVQLGVPTAGYTAPPFQHPQHAAFASHPVSHPHLASVNIAPNVAYPDNTHLGPHPHPHPAATMGDYQNAFPYHAGLNYQPPVPDTTFGAMQHLYVPRFDGGFVPGSHQMGAPYYPVQLNSVPTPCMYTTGPATKPHYYCFYMTNDGVTYYAS